VVSTTLVGIAVVAAIGWRTAKFFERQSRSIEQQNKAVADLRAIADAVQDVVMQPVPRRIGPLRAEVRYLAAAAEASVGGDFYSVLRTPFGVRVLIGDVVGHGLPAVQTSADILRAYRDLAQHEAKLAGLALRLNMAVAQRDDGRTFVTALLLSVPDDGPASLISCGHPPPLLLRGDSVTVVDLPPPALPLGLLHLGAGWCPTSPVTFGPGDRLLLYTDGVTEARDAAGQFYPLADRAAALRRDDPAAFLDALQADLLRHVNARPHAADARLDDDAAMLLLQRDPSAADAVRALDHPLRRAVRDLP
jgi:serine phosphatase RsbU (regulator of sigma subunit)